MGCMAFDCGALVMQMFFFSTSGRVPINVQARKFFRAAEHKLDGDKNGVCVCGFRARRLQRSLGPKQKKMMHAPAAGGMSQNNEC